jgi:hypothetical protein
MTKDTNKKKLPDVLLLREKLHLGRERLNLTSQLPDQVSELFGEPLELISKHFS